VIVSTRGVVFFRAQDNLTDDLQKELIHRLGVAAGKPSTSTLHIHPILNPGREGAPEDPEISIISSKINKKVYKDSEYDLDWKRQKTAQWHSDIAFEPVPADYTALRITELPKTGGGTYSALGRRILLMRLTRVQIPSGRRVTNFTTSFRGPTRRCWRA
jgi:alpha-ketoglutarate-dependent taurine dioxygenase